jgi:hypothetical protein
VEFTARLETPDGWFEPKRVRLLVADAVLVAVIDRADSARLFDGVKSLEAHYLAGYGERSEWLRGWRSPATAPLAARLVIHRAAYADEPAPADTLLLLIGPRG